MSSAGPVDPQGDQNVASQNVNLTASELIDLERAQIGHDLHDLLLPLVFAASATLEPLIDSRAANQSGADGDPILDRVRVSHEWMQQALSVGRNLLTQIYPPELDQLTWLAAAKDTATRICGDECEVIWKVDADSRVCDPNWNRDVAAASYRVLIESLRNAIRHGKADAVSIRCENDHMLVVDDGQGFDPQTVPANRFGIRSMKGRAALVGKRVDVASEPGGPTTVTMSL